MCNPILFVEVRRFLPVAVARLILPKFEFDLRVRVLEGCLISSQLPVRHFTSEAMTRGLFSSAVVATMLAIVICSTTALRAQEKSNLLGLPLKSMVTGGSVMLCGGGDLPDAVCDEFVRLAGGRRARLILIPSAHPFDGPEQMRNRFSGWQDYDVTSFEFLDTDNPEEANDADFIAPIEQATGVWISGGAQSRLIHRYGGRKVEAALRRVVDRGGIVAGYSAGAAVLSKVMIRSGTPSEAVLDTGFGLLDHAIVDSHFTQRARHTRLLNVLDEHPDLIALGVDEASALVIRQNHLRVLGDARVTVMISRGANRPVVVHSLRGGDEAELSLVSSPFGSSPPTIELLLKPKPQ